MFYEKRIKRLEEENREFRDQLKRLEVMMDKPDLKIGDEVRSRRKKIKGQLIDMYLCKDIDMGRSSYSIFGDNKRFYKWQWKANVFNGKEIKTIDANLLSK